MISYVYVYIYVCVCNKYTLFSLSFKYQQNGNHITYMLSSLLMVTCNYFASCFSKCNLPCMLNHSSRFWLFETPGTIACQAPLSMGSSRQEHWSGLPCPPGDLPYPGIKPVSLTSPTLAGVFFTTSATWETPSHSGKTRQSSRSAIEKGRGERHYNIMGSKS